MMQGILENVVAGSHVWVGDPELVWIDGQVLNINGEEAEIQTSNEKKVNWDVLYVFSFHSYVSRYL